MMKEPRGQGTSFWGAIIMFWLLIIAVLGTSIPLMLGMAVVALVPSIGELRSRDPLLLLNFLWMFPLFWFSCMVVEAVIFSCGRLSLQRAEHVRYLFWSNRKEAKRKKPFLRIFGCDRCRMPDCWVIWKNEESMPTLPYPTVSKFDTVCVANDTMPSAFVTMSEDWNCAIASSRAAYHRRIFL